MINEKRPQTVGRHRRSHLLFMQRKAISGIDWKGSPKSILNRKTDGLDPAVPSGPYSEGAAGFGRRWPVMTRYTTMADGDGPNR